MRQAIACAVTLSSIMVGSVGCTTHQCDPSSVTVGPEGGPGWEVVGDCSPGSNGLPGPSCELVWRSANTLGPWQPFAGMGTYTFEFPPPPLICGAQPDFDDALPQALVAASLPDTPSPNLTNGGGQLAEFTGISSTSVIVNNATCADYSVLVWVTVPMVAADGGQDDAECGD